MDDDSIITPEIRKAIAEYNKFMADPEVRCALEMEDKARKFEATVRDTLIKKAVAKAEAKARASGILEGKASGILEGKIAGIMEGKASGIIEGKSCGRLERNNEIALKMLQAGLDINLISEMTGLSSLEIDALCKKTEN